MRGSLLLLSAAVAAIVLGLKALLRLPGVPYNVSELFLDGGSAWRLALFAVAVLWIGPALCWRPGGCGAIAGRSSRCRSR